MSNVPSRRKGFRSRQSYFDLLTDVVIEADVRFLDARSRGRRHIDEDVGYVFQLAAALAGEGDRVHRERLCLFARLHDVRRIAGGGEREEDAAGLGERLDLAREHDVVAVIVPERGEDRRVRRQGYDLE